MIVDMHYSMTLGATIFRSGYGGGEILRITNYEVEMNAAWVKPLMDKLASYDGPGLLGTRRFHLYPERQALLNKLMNGIAEFRTNQALLHGKSGAQV